MSCTFAHCEETPTVEITWSSTCVKVGIRTHEYCESHAERMRQSETVHVWQERVLEVAR